jgi:hypothetical protein
MDSVNNENVFDGTSGVPVNATFMSPKRKRSLSPANTEHPSTQIPQHRVAGYSINESETDGPRDVIDNPLVTESPATANFLRRPTERDGNGQDQSAALYGVKRKDMFGGLESRRSSVLDGNGQNNGKYELANRTENTNGNTDYNASPYLPFGEMKRDTASVAARVHAGEADGAESDCSGMAGRIANLSVRKLKTRTVQGNSPSASPGSSQNSSLNSSFAEVGLPPSAPPTLTPGRVTRRLLTTKLDMNGAVVPSVAMQCAGGVQSGLRGGTLSTGKAVRAESGDGVVPLHIRYTPSPAVDVSHANLTHRSAFQGPGSNAANHSGHTEPLHGHSFAISTGDASHDHSGDRSRPWQDSSVHRAVSSHPPLTPYTPYVSHGSHNALDSYSGYDAHSPQASNAPSAVVQSLPPPPAPAGRSTSDDWGLGVPLDADSPVITPTRVRRPPVQLHAQSRSVSLSQQSHHEAAMGDLGTPVTEVGSPSLIDGIEDPIDMDNEDLHGGHDRREDRRQFPRALFANSHEGSLFQSGDGQEGSWREQYPCSDEDEVKSSAEFTSSHARGKGLFAPSMAEGESAEEGEDPEMASIHCDGERSAPHSAGHKHRREASSGGSNGALRQRDSSTQLSQRVRTQSPLLTSSDEFASTRTADRAARNDVDGYHLFAQRYIASPDGFDHDSGGARTISPFQGASSAVGLKGRTKPFTGYRSGFSTAPQRQHIGSRPSAQSQRATLDFSGDTTAALSETRSNSDLLSLSKSSSGDGVDSRAVRSGHTGGVGDSGMDTSIGSVSSRSSASARPLPDQSAFDAPQSDLSRSYASSNCSSVLDRPPFASPGSARKRRPECPAGSPEAPRTMPPPTPLKGLPLRGPGELGHVHGVRGSPSGPRAHQVSHSHAWLNGDGHGSAGSAHLPTQVPTSAGLAGYTPSPMARHDGGTRAVGIAVPSSVDTVMSSDSSSSDLVVHRQDSRDFTYLDSGSSHSIGHSAHHRPPPRQHQHQHGGLSEPFTSLSRPHDHWQGQGHYPQLPARGMVRQDSVMDTKVLVSQSSRDESPVTFRDDFEVVGLLGSGTFADVYKVRQIPSARSIGGPSAEYYAVKKIKEQFKSKNQRKWLMAEANAMEQLGRCGACPYVVPFVRAWQEECCIYVQMGYAERGTLSELLAHLASPGRRAVPSSSGSTTGAASVASGPLVPDNTVWHIVHDVCAGLDHIHNCGYVHLDIKPANLLISEAGTLQIGDFGMAEQVGSRNDREGDARYAVCC